MNKLTITLILIFSGASIYAQENNHTKNENYLAKTWNSYNRIVKYLERDNKQFTNYVNYPKDKNEPEISVIYINSESFPHLILIDYEARQSFDITLFYGGVLHNKGKEFSQKEAVIINAHLEKILKYIE